ncbi:MAG TPA: thiamine pyrophosphate-binding protein, partial [Candidatus Acidoferrales bacterium]|nr:thiamine pyrophosphate-binding protein [Candidatus Acidoferrales bacterium]
MKLSDYVAHTLAVDYGVRDVFLVSGGGIMHLLDSVGNHPQINYHATFHEQGAVVAAEGYARRSGKLGVALATVGPGAGNAVSGLPGAWIDSIPILVMVGQVRTDIIANYDVQRTYGPQEANTLDMARPVTKYCASVRDPKTVREHIDRAIHAAMSGRPGPVWLEFPVDVTGVDVDEKALVGWTPELETGTRERLRDRAREVAAKIHAAERPLLVPGNGVRLAGAEALFDDLMRRTGIPAVLPITAKDLIVEDHPNYVGIFGSAGQRRANFALQNADLMLALGAGLNIQKCGFNIAGFAPKAEKIVVDIDEAQLTHQALKPDVAVLADVKPFIEELLVALESAPARPSQRWIDACAAWKKRYPVITQDYSESQEFVNSYLFMDALADAMNEGDTLVPGAGLDTVSAYQVFRIKKAQRALISGWGSMGWELPLSIGACWGAGKRRVVTVTGDGSIQWNIQELQTIRLSKLPLKIFVFNNAGFSSIRAT